MATGFGYGGTTAYFW